MKTFISLTGVFWVLCLVCTLAGTLICILFMFSTQHVVGQPPSAIPNRLIIASLLGACALAALVAQLGMITYTIRHPCSSFSSVSACIVWGVVTWLGIIPLCIYESQVQQIPFEIRQSQIPSRKYFRPDREGVFFYSAVYPDTQSGDGIFIDLEGFTDSESRVLRIANVPLNSAAALPFYDLLIQQSLQLPSFLKKVFSVFEELQIQAVSAVKGGFLSWLKFASLGLAVASVMGLRRLFRWRLLNAATIVFGFLAVYVLNAIYYSGRYFFLSAESGISVWILNCVICFICVLTGILLAVFRSDPNQESDK